MEWLEATPGCPGPGPSVNKRLLLQPFWLPDPETSYHEFLRRTNRWSGEAVGLGELKVISRYGPMPIFVAPQNGMVLLYRKKW